MILCDLTLMALQGSWSTQTRQQVRISLSRQRAVFLQRQRPLQVSAIQQHLLQLLQIHLRLHQRLRLHLPPASTPTATATPTSRVPTEEEYEENLAEVIRVFGF